MSSFKVMARHNTTQELHEIWCLDDYFGTHKYGYLPNIKDAKAIPEDVFKKEYTMEKPKS